MKGFWECCYAEYKALGVHFVLVRYGGWWHVRDCSEEGACSFGVQSTLGANKLC